MLNWEFVGEDTATACADTLAASLLTVFTPAQPDADTETLVNLDFVDADLPDVIDTIARLTRKNFV